MCKIKCIPLINPKYLFYIRLLSCVYSTSWPGKKSEIYSVTNCFFINLKLAEHCTVLAYSRNGLYKKSKRLYFVE